MNKFECKHVRDKEHPAITVVTHQSIPGSPTRADDLGTETTLCIICSGRVISLLATLEKEDYDYDRAT